MKLTDQQIVMAIGDMVRRARESSGMACEDLASRSGIDADSLAAMESGEQEPSILEFLHLAEGLNLSAAELVGQLVLDERN
jgi:ribosome-binding protein aMBF1 (putative translation factor)